MNLDCGEKVFHPNGIKYHHWTGLTYDLLHLFDDNFDDN